MNRMLPAELAEFLHLKLVRGFLFVLGRRVVFTLTLGTINTDTHSHFYYSLYEL